MLKPPAILLSLNPESLRSITGCRYMPIMPLVLVNGAEGIGTGWSTSIPNYNPRDIVANLKRLLDDEEPLEMDPWYKGFTGSITEVPSKTAGKSYVVSGKVTQVIPYPPALLLHTSNVQHRLVEGHKELYRFGKKMHKPAIFSFDKSMHRVEGV